jgi:hypothetical protein
LSGDVGRRHGKVNKASGCSTMRKKPRPEWCWKAGALLACPSKGEAIGGRDDPEQVGWEVAPSLSHDPLPRIPRAFDDLNHFSSPQVLVSGSQVRPGASTNFSDLPAHLDERVSLSDTVSRPTDRCRDCEFAVAWTRPSPPTA